jgi:hypothetical protein
MATVGFDKWHKRILIQEMGITVLGIKGPKLELHILQLIYTFLTFPQSETSSTLSSLLSLNVCY